MNAKQRAGDFLVGQVADLEDQLETLYAHLRAIAANPDDNWTGWRHAVEMLIPDSRPRVAELAAELREKGMDDIAERLEFLTGSGEGKTDG